MKKRTKSETPNDTPNENVEAVDDNNEEDDLYGIQKECNIKDVQFGLNKRFKTWYGSNAYFNKDTKSLGYKITKSSPGKQFQSLNISNTNIPQKKKRKLEKSVSFTDVSDTIWLDTLYICEYCFKYTDQEEDLIDHVSFCKYKDKPPGKIMYKSPTFTIRRVKGWRHKIYCQCLALFTKLFLDNKSTYYNLHHYEFYVIYETNTTKPMGFFSKDILSFNKNNLACILTFPPYQRKHTGTALIEFSYKLSKMYNSKSGPELPLSPFGLISYINFWSRTIMWEFLEGELSSIPKVSLDMISSVTGFRIEDILMTLDYLGCLDEKNNINLWKLRSLEHERRKNGKKLVGYYLEDEYYILNL